MIRLKICKLKVRPKTKMAYSNYQIQHHARAQNIKIKINSRGEVIVVAPRICPTFFIDRFVKQHQDWIDKTLKKMRESQPVRKENKNEILLFGKTYQKVIGQRGEFPLGVRISAEKLIITPVTENATSINKSLESFLKSTAEKYVTPRTHQLAKKMEISFHHISFKKQKTRWGSCSSEGNLNFNWML